MSISPDVAERIAASARLESAGQIGAAVRNAEEAVACARALGDRPSIAAALNCLGFLHFRMGHYGEAIALAQEALVQAEATSSSHVDALLLLGMCAAETDDLDASEDYYRRAIDLARQLGYARALFRGLHNLAAGVYMPRGQFDLALAADAEALRLADDAGTPNLAWAPLIIVAWVYYLTGQLDSAERTLERLATMVEAGSAPDGYRCCLAAYVSQDRGEADRALALYDRARAAAERTGEPSLSILVRLGLSRHNRAVGDAATAYHWANDATAIAVRIGYAHFHGMALTERGRAAWEMGHVQAAEDDFRAAIRVLESVGAAFDLAQARLFLAALLDEQKREESAEAWREAAEGILAGNYAFLLERERAIAFPLLVAYMKHPDPRIAALSAGLIARLERIPAPPLRVCALGRFEVRQANRPIPPHLWRQRRAGELFRLLLLAHGRSLTREQIIEALWPGKPPDSAQSLLHQATSALRRALEPELPDKFASRYVRVEEGRVALELPPGSEVDLDVFERQVSTGEWESALSTYAGDLFPDDLYADWATLTRERLRRLYMRALYGAARARQEAGNMQGALDCCLRILEADPWQEDAVLLGMQAYLALGDRASALRLYKDLERTLREELNTAPQPSLQRLYRDLLRHIPPSERL